MSNVESAQLETLRARLLELHKQILDIERADLERIHGAMS